ncbi:MAG TPA: hypothetical protein PLW67_00210 [Prolixibacteraceae bacterium]|nr:hypothetical protein [Prolixibacteraceae bacterium]
MKKYYFILFCVELMVAIGAIPAGYAYIKDPSGAGLGVTVELLANSPLKDFLIPGLFLLIVNGFFQLTGAVFSILNKPVAGKIGLILGFVLMVWIVIQVIWIGLSSFMQPLFFFVGLFEMALGWTIIRKQAGY